MRLLSHSDDHYLFYIFSISLSTGKMAITKNPGCQNDGNEKQKNNGGGKETEQINYVGLKHSMKTMTTTNNNNTIFGIILLKKKHSNYKLKKLRAKERSQFILESNQTIATILSSHRAVTEHNYIVYLSIASVTFLLRG